MKVRSTALIAVVAPALFACSCIAGPVAGIVAIVAGSVAGGVFVAEFDFDFKRAVEPVRRSTSLATNTTGWPIAPVGVPQYNFDDCIMDLRAYSEQDRNVTLRQNGASTLRADNVPQRCMVLASVIVPISGSGPYPIPLGTASLEWRNVTDEQMSTLRDYFRPSSLL